MSLSEPFVQELEQEAATAREMLELVPQDSFKWKSYPKSMPLGRPAGHIAELLGFLVPVLRKDELDLGSEREKAFKPADVSELLDV